jgi:hypothetical protein
MPKLLTLLMVSAAVVATFALTGSIPYAVIAGGITLLGAYFAAVAVLKSAPEVTSDEPVSHPDIIPSILEPAWKRKHREHIAAISAPAIDEDGDILPPTPNMGEDGKPYRGPRYFG